MQAAGYMAKTVKNAPDWLNSTPVNDIYSVSGCVSEDFVDPIDLWKYNGYLLFDTPDTIKQLAAKDGIDLKPTQLFYYEVFEQQFNDKNRAWEPFAPDPELPLNVVTPKAAKLCGFDVVSFSTGSSPECSPLSCNGLAQDIQTNQHCLLSSLEEAKALLENGTFNKSEPGPYRIFAVYTLGWG